MSSTHSCKTQFWDCSKLESEIFAFAVQIDIFLFSSLIYVLIYNSFSQQWEFDRRTGRSF